MKLHFVILENSLQVLGFAGFLDYPPLPPDVCDPANWEGWMQECGYPVTDSSTPLNRYLNFFINTAAPGFVINAIPSRYFDFLNLYFKYRTYH